MNRSPSLFDGARLTLAEAVELTVQSLLDHASRYEHWAIAWSGGKDSTAVVAVIVALIRAGRIRAPRTLTVLYADTRMELPPLWLAANEVRAELVRRGIDTRIVLPPLDERFWVYMLGRGVPPPKNDFRWCTPQLKIEPMEAELSALRAAAGTKILMLTGVRLGESAVRDQKIAVSCGKDGAECGQGWMHLSPDRKHKDNINQYFIPSGDNGVTDTLAPILHWRACHVWDWLCGMIPPDAGEDHGFPTEMIADAYGLDVEGGAIETAARTGCICCPLANRDHALERIVRRPQWAYLTPLLELRELWDELRKPVNRLRKAVGERRKDGSLSLNQNRMGPLTLEARVRALDFVLHLQSRVNEAAASISRPLIDILNDQEASRIRELIEARTWPQKWSGDELTGDQPYEQMYADGSRQLLLDALEGGDS